MTWHVAADTRAAWVGGRTSPVEAASVEQHLMTCADCRSQVAREGELDLDLAEVWSAVADRVEPPRPMLPARIVRAVGVRQPDSLVIGAAPAFTAAWIAATTAVVALTMLASVVEPTRTLGFYLLLAPMVPMVGVAAAYGDGVDPTYELAIASPYPQMRLLLLRTVAVLVLAVPLTVLAGSALDPWWVAVAWLAPGAAFVLLVLASTTWLRPVYATAGVGVAWSAISMAAILAQEQLLLVGELAQLLSALVVIGAVLVLVTRRHHLATAPRS